MNNTNGAHVKMTPGEIVEDFFPAMIPTAKRTIKTLRRQLFELEPLCNNALDMTLQGIHADKRLGAMRGGDRYKKMLGMMAKEFFYDRIIDPIKEHICFLEKLLMWEHREATAGDIDEMMIARARSVPIATLTKVNRAGFMTCPFHNEKTPSCHVFKASRYKCFGCGASGDVIDLQMKMSGMKFTDAVKSLAQSA